MSMQYSDTPVLLTGVTGLLGRHVLYEFLREAAAGNYTAPIYILARSKEGLSPRERLGLLFEQPSLPASLADVNKDEFYSRIRIIECDLRSQDIGRKLEESLSRESELLCINMAASTNLFANEHASRDVRENNYCGTMNLARALLPYTKKFVFISTAYATGIREGLIGNIVDRESKLEFRTPYEYYKHATESELVRVFGGGSCELQIQRPPVICGRLIDDMRFFTSKFDVFYGWGKFFYRMMGSGREENVRILINRNSGLNILPVDYAAKAIVRTALLSIPEINIVNSRCSPHHEYLSHILDRIGFRNYEFVDEMPEDLRKIERLYYQTAGAVFTPYINAPPHEFDAAELRRIIADIPEPDILASFHDLIGYALERGFESTDDISPQPVVCTQGIL
jgi:nucleoside-diphosphate-sugar epimerase